MRTRTNMGPSVIGVVFLAALSACISGASGTAASTDGSTSEGSFEASTADGSATDGSATDGSATDGSATDSDASVSGRIPIVGGGQDASYQFGPNAYGIRGPSFFAKSTKGADTVVVDKTQVGKVCLKGTVDMVPTPADGGHPPYSDYWGVDLGFNLNQDLDAGADASPTMKTPWVVPANVIGFWFTVEGAAIPDIRFKTTPTGKDPSLEQDSCALVTPTSGAPNQVLFTDMYVQCWVGAQGTGPTDISLGLVDVGLQIAADTNAAHAFDFCWTGFGVITK
jgi:hypothetical protein